eukprot:157692-Chlamydomonas_euryale.AAC.1
MAKESQRRRGLDRPSIIMINSFAGKVPLKHMSAFTASKYALAGFTEAIRTEAEPLGVHIGQVRGKREAHRSQGGWEPKGLQRASWRQERADGMQACQLN